MYLKNYFGKNNLKIIEVGVFKGDATSWFLNNLINGLNSIVIAIDTFEGSPEYENKTNFKSIETIFNENIEKTNKKEHVHIMKMLSSHGFNKIK